MYSLNAAHFTALHNINFNWIRGHSHVEGIEAADRAAQEAANTEDLLFLHKYLLENYYF